HHSWLAPAHPPRLRSAAGPRPRRRRVAGARGPARGHRARIRGRGAAQDARAVWLSQRLLQWPRTDTGGRFRLYHSAEGRIVARRGAPVAGADGALALSVARDVPADVAARFRWVGAGAVLSVDPDDDAALAAL